MINFEYRRASSLDDAVSTGAGARRPARFVAGGTTLIDLMKLDVERPSLVVDINALGGNDSGLSAVTDLLGGGLRLGVLARMSDVAWDARVKERYPLVSQSLLLAASGQVRNMATIGGNILQRTRWRRRPSRWLSSREPSETRASHSAELAPSRGVPSRQNARSSERLPPSPHSRPLLPRRSPMRIREATTPSR